MKIQTKTGIFMIVVGVLLVFISLYAEAATFDPAHINGPTFVGTFIKLVDVVGIAIIAIGALNILLETRDWREYFSKLLREIVVEQSYLDTLDKDKLTVLQTNVLKAVFRDQMIDREGSFLNYFHSNLHKYIAEPYREDVSSEISITEDAGLWKVIDKVTYVCRKSAGSIQSTIVWHVDEQEHEDAGSLKVDIQFPYTLDVKDRQKNLYSGATTPGKAIELPLSEYSHIDGLIITAEETYRVRKADFQYWTMAHPTKNFNLTVIFPTDHKIQVKPLVLSPELLLVTERPGYYSAKYDSWMLPESGMAFYVRPESLVLKKEGTAHVPEKKSS
jgi:hypothetical protein